MATSDSQAIGHSVAEINPASFVAPAPQVALDGAPGLALHDIARSLGAEFKNVKRRYEELAQLGEIGGAPIGARQEIQEVGGHSYAREVASYVLAVDDAKFLVTQYANPIGRAYCRWLIQQEREWQTVQASLADPDMAERFAQALLERVRVQRELAAKQAVLAHVERSLTSSQGRNGSITRENTKLKSENQDLRAKLGDAVNFKTVKAALKLHPSLASINNSVLGKRMTALSREMNVEIREVPDMAYGTVRAYHASVWQAFLRTRGEAP